MATSERAVTFDFTEFQFETMQREIKIRLISRKCVRILSQRTNSSVLDYFLSFVMFELGELGGHGKFLA